METSCGEQSTGAAAEPRTETQLGVARAVCSSRQALRLLLAAEMDSTLVVSKHVQAKQNTPASQL